MGRPLRVLMVEDSEDDELLLLRALRRGSYEPAAERVETAAAMQAALDGGEWDLVLSDYSMPYFSAPAALALLQESGLDLPFIIVSGAIGEEIAVEAMRVGAHDYVSKDNLARLIPAIERELRDAEVRRERQRAEEALRESERRAREQAHQVQQIIRTVPEGALLLVRGRTPRPPGRASGGGTAGPTPQRAVARGRREWLLAAPHV
jgi:DNA-binding NtrC family response regulator